MRTWVLGVLMVLMTTPRLAGGTATPFQLGDQGGVIVQVMLNGAGPFPMLLDTGATHSAITEDVAAAAGARPIAKAVVISTVGETVRAIVSIDRLELGPIVTEHTLPSVVPANTFGPGIQGLIGQDVLAWLRYTLDFKRREVEWHASVPPVPGESLSLAFEHGRFLVELPQRTHTLRLVPDSGADSIVLFDGAEKPSEFVETGVTVGLRSAHAVSEVRRIRIPELRIGARTLRNLPAVAIARADRLPSEGDGLLPLHLFERVTFDGPARRLILG